MSTQQRIKDYERFKEDEQKQWKGPFYFVQAADPQFGLIERYLEKKVNYTWEKEKVLSKLSVEKLNALNPKPKFFVICGDLCDATPVDEWEIRQKQEKDFWDIFSKINPDIALVCVCGNHDVGDIPSSLAVQRYRSSFGKDYFSFWVGGVFFIVINSQYFYDGSQVPEIAREQEVWLDEQLKIGAKSHCGPVIFQHIPWFLDDPEDQKSDYFTIPYDKRKPMLEKLNNAGVRYVFNGHLHRNNFGQFKNVQSIVSSAIGGQIGPDKSGFRIVKVLSDSLSHKYYPFDDVPTNVDLS